MQRLEVSGAVRPLYYSLGVKGYPYVCAGPVAFRYEQKRRSLNGFIS